MSITTFDEYIAAPKQYINISKVTNESVVSGTLPHNISIFAGDIEPLMPAAATAPTTGVIVTPSTLAGVPTIISTGNTQYLSKASFACSVLSTVKLHDLIYRAGTYSTTSVAVTGPDVGARVGNNYYNTQLWVECVTPYTSGLITINVTYTSPLSASRSTSAITVGGMTIAGAMYRIPLQAGDYGIKSIQNVAITSSTGGTCNVLITRPLWTGRAFVTNGLLSTVDGPLDTGMPIIYPGTCLFPILYPDSTSTGFSQLSLEIAG